MKKYLITGKNGLVASNICQTDFFKNNQAFSHLQLNITHFEDIEKAIIKHIRKL